MYMSRKADLFLFTYVHLSLNKCAAYLKILDINMFHFLFFGMILWLTSDDGASYETLSFQCLPKRVARKSLASTKRVARKSLASTKRVARKSLASTKRVAREWLASHSLL